MINVIYFPILYSIRLRNKQGYTKKRNSKICLSVFKPFYVELIVPNAIVDIVNYFLLMPLMFRSKLFASTKHDHENPTLLKQKVFHRNDWTIIKNLLPSDVACNKQFPSPLVTNGYNLAHENF
jgi:hypothetical protein